MPSKQQSDILTVYQTQFFAKLHKQNWLYFKIFVGDQLKQWKGKKWMQQKKLLAPLTIFLSASYVKAFLSLNQVAGNNIQINHLIQFDKTNKQSCKPICEQTKQMGSNAELPWRSLAQISLFYSFDNSNHLKTWFPIHWCSSLLHPQGWMPS